MKNRIKLNNVKISCFDCIYCEEENDNEHADSADIYPEKDMYNEKFYRVRCPACGRVNYVIPNVSIEPIPFTYEDYKRIKNKPEEIKQIVYMNGK